MKIKQYLFIILLFSYTLIYAKQFNAFDIVSMSSDAYTSKEHILKKYKNNVKVYSSKTVLFFTLDTEDTLYINFRGTANFANVQTNAEIQEYQFGNNKNARIHMGFYSEALKSKDQINHILNKNKKIVISGHSLGGAVALAMASELFINNYDVEVYTFGAPPIGNKEFINRIVNLKHHRYEHDYDMVPKLDNKVIGVFKYALTLIKDNIKLADFLVELINIIESIPYNYIHHSEKIELSNEAVLNNEMKSLPYVVKMVMTPLFYHSIDTYKDFLKNTKD